MRALVILASKVLQYLFGAIFVFTSIGKLLDNRGFAVVLEAYQIFPASVLLPLALLLSLFEFFLGIKLFRGRALRSLAGVVICINAGYLALAAVTLARGIPIANCGCFGVFLARPLTTMTLVEDGVLLALSLIFWFSLKSSGRK